MKIKEKNKKDIWIYIVTFLISISVIGLYPNLRSKVFIIGHDFGYQLLRTDALYQEIMSGNWFPKINNLFYGGYGYASSLFYPDLFLYIPVLLRILGVGLQRSYQIFMIIIVVATYITAYYSGKNILKDKKMGIIAAVVYSLATYHVTNLYIRAAIGEALAQIFIPLIIYGIYNLLYEEFSKPSVLGIGFFCLVYSHTITFVMCFILLLVLLLFHIKELIKKPKIVIKLFFVGFIVICLTSYWWGPVIEQVIFDKFQVSNPWTTLSQNGLDLSGVLVGDYGIGNILFIIIIVGIIYYYKNKKENRVNLSKLLAIVVTGIFLTTNYFDWRILEPVLNSIQFPWRINTINTYFCALLVAVLYGTIRKNNIWILILLFFMSLNAGLVLERYSSNDFVLSDDFFKDKGNTYGVGGGEWLPVGTDTTLLTEYNTINTDTDKININDNFGELNFKHDGLTKEYLLPRIFYKGYSGYIKDESGVINELNVDKGDNNLTVLYVDENVSGDIVLKYEKTLIQRICFIVSVGTMIILISYFMKDTLRKKIFKT